MSSELPAPAVGVLPPRRAVIRLSESQIKDALGLQDDESVRALVYDPGRGDVKVVVESPRLPPVGFHHSQGFTPSFDTEPPYISLPISDHYEERQVQEAVPAYGH